MALREARAAWRRLLLFFLALALGVGAIVTLRSLVGSVRAALEREARSLLAGDVLVQTNRALDPRQRAALERHLASPGGAGRVRARSEVVTTTTMARPSDDPAAPARLVELRGIDAAVALDGAIELEGGAAYSPELLRGRGALVAPELLASLDLRVGGRLSLGTQAFEVRGVVLREPGRRPSAFSLGPRVLVGLDDLRGSGLVGPFGRALHQLLLRVDEPAIEPLQRALSSEFAAQYVSVHTARGARGRADEGLQRSEGFLSLVGLSILVLGGVGVASVVRAFVEERLKTLAVLKCLGASGAQVLAVDLLQVLALGLLGSGFGLLLSRLALAAVPPELARGLGVTAFAQAPAAALQGLGVGLAVTLLFALPPLLDARRAKPLLLLRDETPPPSRRDPWRLAAIALLLAGLVALSAWQAGSWRVGLVAAGGFAALVALLLAAGGLLVRLAAALGRRARFPLRQALSSLGRPGNHTRPVLLAVGLGSFFVLAVLSLQAHLVEQFADELRADAPDLFLIDVQPDQADALRAAVLRATGHAPRLVPVLRARVTGVRGRDVQLDSFEQVRGRGSLGREFVVTWRARLEPNERLLEGRLWDAGEAPPGASAEVSIEKSLRERYGIRPGDELRFDVLGRELHARVTSVREVAWGDARSGGFMFVFRPGALRGAPWTFVAFARAPEKPFERARVQRALADAFPNVSAIDLRDVLASLRALIGQVSRAVQALGALTLASGALILLGAVAVTRRRRRYEAAVLRALGARTRQVLALLVAEYALLGALAGVIGALGALALDAALTREVLERSWRPAWGIAASGVLATSLGVGLLGFAASLDVARRKPLSVLRGE